MKILFQQYGRLREKNDCEHSRRKENRRRHKGKNRGRNRRVEEKTRTCNSARRRQSRLESLRFNEKRGLQEVRFLLSRNPPARKHFPKTASRESGGIE